MKEEQDEWLEDILHSAQGKAPVAPSNQLFENIQLQLDKAPDQQSLRVVNNTRKWVAAAALVIGLLNAFAFQQLLSSNDSDTTNISSQANYESLISDYNLY